MKYYFLILLSIISNSLSAQFCDVEKGDVLSINGVKGIVFDVNEDGSHGTIMSVKAFRGKKKIYCTKSSYLKKINMIDTEDGKGNTESLYAYAYANYIPLFEYPVFNWCKSLGEGWYIPSVEQLKQFVNYWLGNEIEEVDWDSDEDEDVKPEGYSHRKTIDRILLDAGGIPFLNGVFTSTKDEKGKVLVFQYDNKKDFWQFVRLNPMKIDKDCVGRAFYDF